MTPKNVNKSSEMRGSAVSALRDRHIGDQPLCTIQIIRERTHEIFGVTTRARVYTIHLRSSI